MLGWLSGLRHQTKNNNTDKVKEKRQKKMNTTNKKSYHTILILEDFKTNKNHSQSLEIKRAFHNAKRTNP